MAGPARRVFETASMNINWFPGHMASAARKIEQRLKVTDMVIEVRDARVPLCSRCGRLEELIQKKRRIVVMNKSDLIGPADVEQWVRHFAKQGQAVAFTNAAKGSRIRDLMPEELLKRGLITRADRMLLFMIIGIPNTGKSSMINALRRQGMRARRQAGGSTNVAETGARPGVTRHVSTVQFCSEPPVRSANFKCLGAYHCSCIICQGNTLTMNNKLLRAAHQAFLIDTPGIMHTALSPEDGLKLALTGAIKENIVDPVTLADYLLFLLNDRGQVSYANTFGLAAPTDDIGTLLDAVASKMGFRTKRPNAGGSKVVEDSASPNALRSAQHLIKQYRAGTLGKFVLDESDSAA